MTTKGIRRRKGGRQREKRRSELRTDKISFPEPKTLPRNDRSAAAPSKTRRRPKSEKMMTRKRRRETDWGRDGRQNGAEAFRPHTAEKTNKEKKEGRKENARRRLNQCEGRRTQPSPPLRRVVV